MSNELETNQRLLWENQHATRGNKHECGSSLRFTPNDTAVKFAEFLPSNSRILEIGSANGRDARYWAALGHHVVATDFSLTALKQLKGIGCEQGVMNNISLVIWDICIGKLPINQKASINAFYARSALHVDDSVMMQIANQIEEILSPNGYILIEGKNVNDHKIVRSHKKGNGIAIDHEEGGHMRRIWTTEFTKVMCDKLGWSIVELTDQKEEWQGVPATFLRLIARKT